MIACCPTVHARAHRVTWLWVFVVLDQWEVKSRLARQRIPDLLNALRRPRCASEVAQRVEKLVLGMHDDLLDTRGWLAHDDIHILPDLQTERVQRQIVHVFAEWVFDLATNERNTQNDVCCKDTGRDCDPTQKLVQLERQKEDVYPCDLADGNAVRDGQRGVENAVCACEDVVESRERVERLCLVDGDFEGAVVVD